MALHTRSYVTEARSSSATGIALGSQVRTDLGDDVKVVIAYMTVNHDQGAFLRGLRGALGDAVPIIGCSGQGVIARGTVREEGYAASLLALGGDSIECATACVEAIAVDTHAKGRALGAALRAQSRMPPKYIVMHYDPLAGANMDAFLEGLHLEIECPVTGGAASHTNGVPMARTFQYSNDQVLSGAAVAVALGGDVTMEGAISMGCSPVGVEMVVTRADGNVLLELDGRPALEVWQQITQVPAESLNADSTAALAIGVPSYDGHLIRASFGLDIKRGGIMLQAAIEPGTKVMLYHRTVADVLEGTRRVVRELVDRVAGKRIRAVLAFECGARTAPFLGEEATLAENLELQHTLAPDAEYAGVVVWGELFPVGGRPAFHNYTYPLLVIAE
jgi:hypothetical protein